MAKKEMAKKEKTIKKWKCNSIEFELYSTSDGRGYLKIKDLMKYAYNKEKDT